MLHFRIPVALTSDLRPIFFDFYKVLTKGFFSNIAAGHPTVCLRAFIIPGFTQTCTYLYQLELSLFVTNMDPHLSSSALPTWLKAEYATLNEFKVAVDEASLTLGKSSGICNSLSGKKSRVCRCKSWIKNRTNWLRMNENKEMKAKDFENQVGHQQCQFVVKAYLMNAKNGNGQVARVSLSSSIFDHSPNCSSTFKAKGSMLKQNKNLQAAIECKFLVLISFLLFFHL